MWNACSSTQQLLQLLLPYQSASGTAGRDSWTAGSCCRKAGTGPHLHPSSGAVFAALLGSCRCKLGAARREPEYRQFVHTFSTGIVRDLRQIKIWHLTFKFSRRQRLGVSMLAWVVLKKQHGFHGEISKVKNVTCLTSFLKSRLSVEVTNCQVSRRATMSADHSFTVTDVAQNLSGH